MAQEGDFMVPFSPDRPSVASDLAESPDGIPKKQSRGGMSGANATSPQEADPLEVALAAGEVGEASAAAKPAAHAGGTAPALEVASTGAQDSGGESGGVRLAAGSAVKEFCFSDDDEEEEEARGGEDSGAAMPGVSSQHTTPATTRAVDDDYADDSGEDFDQDDSEKEQGGKAGGSTRGGDGREREPNKGGGRQRRQRTKGDDHKTDDRDSSGDDSLDDDASGGPSTGERARRRDYQEALLNPLGSLHGHLASLPGQKHGARDSAGAPSTTATWAAPDFAFSSDDDFDIELSASERSLERPDERRSPGSPRTERGV